MLAYVQWGQQRGWFGEGLAKALCKRPVRLEGMRNLLGISRLAHRAACIGFADADYRRYRYHPLISRTPITTSIPARPPLCSARSSARSQAELAPCTELEAVRPRRSRRFHGSVLPRQPSTYYPTMHPRLVDARNGAGTELFRRP